MTSITPNLKRAAYYFDERHFVLSSTDGPFGPNIGSDGHNLTIAVLSLNRAKVTARLIDSITSHLINFAGELLIGDNGSDPAELAQLRSHLETFPYRWRLIEMGENRGVAGGRNRLMREARTEWVLSVDNDIYFLWNPIPKIQDEIASLGCHFMSFPLLNPGAETVYAHGACLQTVIQDGRPRLTINPIAIPGSPVGGLEELDQAFFSTFLFGGASILNRNSFQRLGGFDETMLIGFEDIDFSLRVFREGLKVGTSAQRFLVHDHPKAETSSDSNYERTRFSRKILYDSARWLEAKSGFKIWGDEVESWMRSNDEKQGWISQHDTTPDKSPSDDPAAKAPRPKVALITDTDNWAFANISRQLKRCLSDRFDIEIIPLVTLGELERNRWLATNCTGFFADGGASAVGMALVATEDFDIVHVFWREFLTIIDTPLLEDYARRLGLSYAEFRRRFVENRILSTSVYDHLFLDQSEIEKREDIFNGLIAGYYVASERLRRIYETIPSYPDPDAVLSDGVDLSLFKPSNLERFDDIARRPVRVGWVGHSAWAASIEDFKGVNTILKPTIEELQQEGLNIVASFADRKERFIPHNKMSEYYATIDVLICTSKIEGTPNPVLEAMACGIPVISTDVGVVPEAFGKKQRKYILAERSIQCLKQALRALINDPGEFRDLSAENLESISAWDWSHKAEAFVGYFHRLLERKRALSGDVRSKMCMLPFSNPSVETDGSIRLCSASSIFAYYDQTNMGNCRTEGLAKVWSGERYREVRTGLLTGNLKPYCAQCEYRFDAPAWMVRLHLGLHAYHNGVRTSDILRTIAAQMHRYDEYVRLAPTVSVNAYPLDADVRAAASRPLEHESGQRRAWDDGAAPPTLVRSSELPIYMDFNTLNRCNVSCTMCPPAIRFDSLGAKRDPYYRLTLDEYRKVTANVRISTAHFVGAYAEPLLNKEIFALVTHAKGNGAFTAITTNAMALSREFGEKLLAAGLDMLTISLHGATAETAERIMLKSNFSKIIANIETFVGLMKEQDRTRPEIYFNYVAQRDNARDMPDFIDLASRLGVRFVNIIHLIDGDAAVDKSQNLVDDPGLLVPNVLEAQERARRSGVNLFVSPAYLEVVKRFAGGAVEAPAA